MDKERLEGIKNRLSNFNLLVGVIYTLVTLFK